MNQVSKVNNNMQAAHQTATVADWLDNSTIRQKFAEVLDKGANGFISSLLSLVKSTPALSEADPKTIMAAAMTAATLKLPINPNLGLAYIVPYRNHGQMQAQFQMGWKGFVQLAERSGQYKTINTSVVYEGQVEDIDFITGEIIRGKKVSDTVIGYVAYIELVNGFKKTLYMTREEMEAHARQFSKSYGYDIHSGKKSSVWSTNFDAMAQKTVLKQLISKYGIMSIDMQNDGMSTAIASDQAVIKQVGEQYDYVDNSDEPIDAIPADTSQDGSGAPETIEPEQVHAQADKAAQSEPQEATDIGLGLE